ncbi:MAG: VWA domain-containing protein [Magnetospirillum sp.]|nr:VWA domain-containing protein [Magnetospirillum sp.]
MRRVAAIPVPARDGRGRLMFAMDATASREATWRQAQAIHAAMFEETARLGGLDVQLVYYRGLDECRHGPWTGAADRLLGQLSRVACRGGETQIGRVLAHAIAETRARKVDALVFVGDCLEEDIDVLCRQAGELGLLGTPLFLFHEGEDAAAARGFAQMAKVSGGACCRFDASSAGQLRALLSAVAVFAAGGRKALADYGTARGGLVLQISRQMGGG